MKVTPTRLPEVLIVEPRVFPDRSVDIFMRCGWKSLVSETRYMRPFVQDNVSRSVHGTLRSSTSKNRRHKEKLVTVLTGKDFDVAVDIRRDSPRFGQWVGLELDARIIRVSLILPGFAHGFCVTSQRADFLYKCTEYYSPATEGAIRWNDPNLAIDWPVPNPVLSEKDAVAPLLSEAQTLPSMDDNAKIFLTGAKGQLGRVLHQLLPAIGPVTAVDRDEVDFSDTDALHSLLQIEKPTLIVNAAAFTDVDGAETAPDSQTPLTGRHPR